MCISNSINLHWLKNYIDYKYKWSMWPSPLLGRDSLPFLCESFYIHQQGLVSRKCSGQSSTMHQEDLAWFSLSVHFSITVFANWNYKYLKYSYLYIDKTKYDKCEIQQMTKFKLFGLLEKKFKLFGLFLKKL